MLRAYLAVLFCAGLTTAAPAWASSSAERVTPTATSPGSSVTDAAPAACAPRLEGPPGRPVTLPARLEEPDRKALLAAVHLALNDPRGRGDWPGTEIAKAPPCEISRFEADGATWVVSAGADPAPPRWVEADGREERFFLARGPGLGDAGAWDQARRPAVTLTGPAHYFLTASIGEELFVFRVYEGAPDNRRLADDLFEIISGGTSPIAAYDPDGEAASLFLETADRRGAALYRPDLIHDERKATLFAPDGEFFVPAAGGGVRLRGSNLLCPAAFGDFERRRIAVLDARPEGLDLSCQYLRGEATITAFITRMPNAAEDRQWIRAAFEAAKSELGTSGKLPRFKPGSGLSLLAGEAWVDKDGLGEGLWFLRRGEYVIEIQAAFGNEDYDATLEALGLLLDGARP